MLPGWKLRIGYAANFNHGGDDRLELLRGFITFADQTQLVCDLNKHSFSHHNFVDFDCVLLQGNVS